jgi:hypothetical protein
MTGPPHEHPRYSSGTAPTRSVLPGLTRLSIGLARRTLGRGTDAASLAVHTGGEILDRVRRGDPPMLISRDLATEMRDLVDAALGARHEAPEAVARRPDPRAPEDLRTRGAALLARSADVDDIGDEGRHPAYARMLAETTPDEARILRLLYLFGPQPALDIRTTRPLGVGSELVAGGLNMVADYAGLRRKQRVQPYLTNLNRQGLVSFSKEKVDDPDRYQLIEAQPDVVEALRRAGRAPRIVYRSIRLTTFGRDFCRACFPLGGDAGRSAATPESTIDAETPGERAE